jgi:hypothetical protein
MTQANGLDHQAQQIEKQRAVFQKQIDDRQAKRNPRSQGSDLMQRTGERSQGSDMMQRTGAPSNGQPLAPAPASGAPTRAEQTPGPAVQVGGGGNGVQPPATRSDGTRQPTSVSVSGKKPGGAMPPAKGDRNNHNGRLYLFDGKQWVGQ